MSVGAPPVAQPVTFRRRVAHPKGRPVVADDRERVRALLAGEAPARDRLIEYLHRINDAEGCLPKPLLVALAEHLGLAPVEVYEVATFYHHFRVVERREADADTLVVRVCESLSCAMSGAAALAERLADAAPSGVRVERVPCIGQCDGAPAAVVAQRVVRDASPERVRALIDGALGAGLDPVRAHAARAPELPSTDAYAQARAAGVYDIVGRVAGGELSREAVFDVLERAGLRGMGGAGFPTARKWRIVAAQPAPRLMVVNADEGEPGTFKDRHTLETDPHGFLAGLLVAAWAVQASACYLYLRDEYAGLRALFERELPALIADPPLPRDAMPQIHLRRGAGAYICGEESALIESIEGKRGMPRLRPPFVAERGLFGRPTLVNNVETLAWVPRILEHGADWFAHHGRRGRRGLRAFSVSGRVRLPGVKLAPAGISARELIDEHCGGMLPGHELYAYLPGGASGGILPAALADLPLDFDTLQAHDCFIGSAAVIVLSQADRARDAAANLMHFFRHESCGQCTPCRVGTAKTQALLAAPRWDVARLEALSRTMADASICGLGQAAPNPVRSVLRHFGHEVGLSAGKEGA